MELPEALAISAWKGPSVGAMLWPAAVSWSIWLRMRRMADMFSSVALWAARAAISGDLPGHQHVPELFVQILSQQLHHSPDGLLPVVVQGELAEPAPSRLGNYTPSGAPVIALAGQVPPLLQGAQIPPQRGLAEDRVVVCLQCVEEEARADRSALVRRLLEDPVLHVLAVTADIVPRLSRL